MTATSPSPAEPAPIPVVVAGALGRMGAEVIKAVVAAPDCTLVGAIDTTPGHEGEDVGLALGLGELEVALSGDFEGTLCQASQAVRQAGPGGGAVLVDFTHPSVVFEHCRGAFAYGVHPVIGTTGLRPDQLADLAAFAEKASMGGAVVPNFCVGMVLLQQAAAAAARFYDYAELTELHHNRKADAPSGTCLKTAELMEELGKPFKEAKTGERIEGRLVRTVEMTSGRHALIERSRDFTLVPWRPVLERQLGKPVAGIMRDGGINWTVGRQRSGPSIS